MAGPNYIHVRDSDNIVVAVYGSSVVEPAGVTEYYETHPVFQPLWTLTEWERTGVNTYVDNGTPPEGPEPDTDAIVSVSADDATSEFLDTKITAGEGITLTINADSLGAETLEIARAATSKDYFANGAINNVKTNSLSKASWGEHTASGGICVIADGEVVGMSIAIDEARTAGTLELFLSITGVAQNGAGETVFIDATNTMKNSIIFSTPIQYTAEDIITLVVEGDGYSPGASNATVAFWYRDR